MKFKLPKLPKFPKLPRLPKLPKVPRLPELKIEPVRKIVAFLIKHKISLTILISVIAFITVAMWYRGYLLSKMNAASQNSNDEIFYSTKTDNPGPTITIPIPPSPSDNNSVLGTSNNSNSYNNTSLLLPTPFPTFAPLPTIAPLPATTITTTNTSSTSNNSGNPSCTTGDGVPNAWYSDVYPNPPVTTNTGSITLIVYIRDCNKNTAPVSDNLTVTLTSNDSTAKINGSTSPVNIQVQNGQASFSVSSQNTTTDTFTIQDTTSNFTVTDIKNHNPSVAFTNTSSGNSTGNSHCTTANGVPNFWYSEVSPASPVAAATGSTVTFTVNIQDCGKNNVSSDNLTFSQTSSDTSLTVNDSAPPVSVQAQNGQATFTVTSQNAGKDTFTIQDTTSNFTVTDTNNSPPSVVFSGSSTSTPTPTPSPADTPTPTPTNVPTPTPTTIPAPTGS
jgi:hypothetical protein